jgi:hypothetical protein
MMYGIRYELILFRNAETTALCGQPYHQGSVQLLSWRQSQCGLGRENKNLWACGKNRVVGGQMNRTEMSKYFF